MNLFFLASDWFRANLWDSSGNTEASGTFASRKYPNNFCLLTNFGTFGENSANLSWKPWAGRLFQSIHDNYYEIHNDDQNHLNVKNEDKNVQIDIQGVVMKSELTWQRKLITK